MGYYGSNEAAADSAGSDRFFFPSGVVRFAHWFVFLFFLQSTAYLWGQQDNFPLKGTRRVDKDLDTCLGKRREVSGPPVFVWKLLCSPAQVGIYFA